MAGTWVLRTEHPMTDPTGGFILDPGDGTWRAVASSNGSVLVPLSSAASLYLDGFGAPTLLSSLPRGWTPDDAFVLHTDTFVAVVGDSLTFAIPSMALSVLVDGQVAFAQWTEDHPLSGMTREALTGLFGTSLQVDATVVDEAAVYTRLVPGGAWDALYNISIAGTYHVSLGLLPPMPSRTPMTQGGGKAARGRR